MKVEAAKAFQTRLIASTTSAYYKLQMLPEQLKIAQKGLSLSDSTVQVVLLQLENGEVTTLAVQ